jgi:hypothetical protein
MPFTSPMSIVSRSAVVGAVTLAAVVHASAQETRYFDPVLDGGLCAPSGDSRRLLLAYYQKVAAATYQLAQATETKPFPPPPAGSTPPGASNARPRSRTA